MAVESDCGRHVFTASLTFTPEPVIWLKVSFVSVTVSSPVPGQ
ncbi:hypothetical protein [Hydrogenophaga soli]